jgi:hypothetical protein
MKQFLDSVTIYSFILNDNLCASLTIFQDEISNNFRI